MNIFEIFKISIFEFHSIDIITECHCSINELFL